MDLPTVETLDRPTDDAALRARLATVAATDGVLAGGTWLFSVPQPGLRGLVDVTALGWPPVTVTRDGDVVVAATATLADLTRWTAPDGVAAAPLLRGCCEALVGSAKIRNVATVGGNIALGLPAAPMITLAAVLDGVARVWTPDGGARDVAVVDLVTGAQRTALAPGEVLRSVTLPARAMRARTALRKVSLTALGRSAVLVAGRVDVDGSCVVALTASLERPAVLRFDAVPDAAGLRDAVDAGRDWYDDPHGSPDWRRAMTVHAAEQVRADLA